MPVRNKFFVLSKHREGSGFGDEEHHCVVVANSPEEVARLLRGKYEPYSNGLGTVRLSKDMLSNTHNPMKKDEFGNLEYKLGPLYFLIEKDEDDVELTLAELPIMGECQCCEMAQNLGLDRDEHKGVGTLSRDVEILCPDDYRLVYKKDKIDK